MDIDIVKIRKGEKIKCPLCNKGYFISATNAKVDKASAFKCSSCGEKLIINYRMTQPTE